VHVIIEKVKSSNNPNFFLTVKLFFIAGKISCSRANLKSSIGLA
jgi:hypothetical protein